MADPDLPPLTGHPVLDRWRLRRRAELAGELPPVVPEQRQPTRSESLLWQALQRERLGWEREYATGPYRLDFYCPTAKLAVEVDGGRHAGSEAWARDIERDAWHAAEQGVETFRVSARDVERDLDGVMRDVRRRVRVRLGLEDDLAKQRAAVAVPAALVDPLPAPPLTSRRPIARNRRAYRLDDARRSRAEAAALLERRRRIAVVVLVVLALVLLLVESQTGAVGRAYFDVVEWAVRGVLEPLVPKPSGATPAAP